MSQLKKIRRGLFLPFPSENLPFMARVPEGREGPRGTGSLAKRVKKVPDLFYYYCTGH
jgi:hypothetical protein